MGAQATLGPFVAEDSFLRHVDRKRHIKNGTVSHEVFKDRNETLSFTYQDQTLRTEEGLTQYQRDKELAYGDLPGLCMLTFHDLTVLLQPPLPPRSDPVPEDEKYGHLHCCTDRPTDDVHRRTMAHLAERHETMRPLVPKKKRDDLPGNEPVGSSTR